MVACKTAIAHPAKPPTKQTQLGWGTLRTVGWATRLVFPVLLGKGKRIFSDGTPPREFALVSTQAVGSGVIISTYKPNGPLRTSSYADAGA